jgi:hypothetical protein
MRICCSPRLLRPAWGCQRSMAAYYLTLLHVRMVCSRPGACRAAAAAVAISIQPRPGTHWNRRLGIAPGIHEALAGPCQAGSHVSSCSAGPQQCRRSAGHCACSGAGGALRLLGCCRRADPARCAVLRRPGLQPPLLVPAHLLPQLRNPLLHQCKHKTCIPMSRPPPHAAPLKACRPDKSHAASLPVHRPPSVMSEGLRSCPPNMHAHRPRSSTADAHCGRNPPRACSGTHLQLHDLAPQALRGQLLPRVTHARAPPLLAQPRLQLLDLRARARSGNP